MAKIDNLRTLGYTVGLAHGSVEVEQAALDDARAAADPNLVATQADQITTDTIRTLDAKGLLPENQDDRLKLATDIAEHALEQIVAATSENVAFHERALKIAEESADVWVVQHVVEVNGEAQTCAQVYLSCKPDGTGWNDNDQALLDALADKTSFDERVFQVQNADAIAAAQQLEASGANVSRDPGATSFTIDGKTLTPAKTVAAADALP